MSIININNTTIHNGASLEVLKGYADNTFDAIVTDPPYGLSDHSTQDVLDCVQAWVKGEEYAPSKRGFAGQSWDAWVPSPILWKECLRVLKPGAHLVAFSGDRTYDLMGLSIRLSGFQIRQGLFWHYATGMPRGLNLSKAIDAYHGAEREKVGGEIRGSGRNHTLALNEKRSIGVMAGGTTFYRTLPASEMAKKFDDFNTLLKPTCEPIVMAQKPFEGSTVENLIKHGVGGINIGACRVGESGSETHAKKQSGGMSHGVYGANEHQIHNRGRFPGTTLLAHAEGCSKEWCISGCVVRQFKSLQGEDYYPEFYWQSEIDFPFFYTNKSMPGEKDLGLDHLEDAINPATGEKTDKKNFHPSPKPVDLMRWLCRLVVPPGGSVLDPFAGSGTTGVASELEGFKATLIERESRYIPILDGRIAYAAGIPRQMAVSKKKQVSLF